MSNSAAQSLKPVYLELLQRQGATDDQALPLWTEVEQQHEAKNRHYHSLNHLQHLYHQLLPIKEKLEDWDTILFTLFYHDVIYNAKKSNNEEQSAIYARVRMEQLQMTTPQIDRCKAQIIATKKHALAQDPDTNFFTDADLSILGANWEHYEQYHKGVRKEYAMYPNLLYNPGRKKVLKHFLAMERIFKTDHFYNALESKARVNLRRELELL